MSPRQKRRKLIKRINKLLGMVRLVDFVFIFGRSWKKEMRRMPHIKLLNHDAIVLGGNIYHDRMIRLADVKWPSEWPRKPKLVKSTVFGDFEMCQGANEK